MLMHGVYVCVIGLSMIQQQHYYHRHFTLEVFITHVHNIIIIVSALLIESQSHIQFLSTCTNPHNLPFKGYESNATQTSRISTFNPTYRISFDMGNNTIQLIQIIHTRPIYMLLKSINLSKTTIHGFLWEFHKESTINHIRT